jgi:hypothetical protein
MGVGGGTAGGVEWRGAAPVRWIVAKVAKTESGGEIKKSCGACKRKGEKRARVKP